MAIPEAMAACWKLQHVMMMGSQNGGFEMGLPYFEFESDEFTKAFSNLIEQTNRANEQLPQAVKLSVAVLYQMLEPEKELPKLNMTGIWHEETKVER